MLVTAATNTILTGLTPNTAYNWRVRTVDCSNYSTVQNFSTLAVCGVPAPVASSPSTNSFIVSWPAISGATSYIVQRRLQGATTWTVSTITTTSILINGLSPGNTYEYQVSATCPSGNSGFSVVQTIKTLTVVYCTSNGTNNTKEWIDYIQLGNISRNSAAEPGGYINTGASTNLIRGATYTITFSAGFSASIIKENWKMFIDYNVDGDFNDAGETIVNTSKTGAGNFTATFTVPTSALLSGTTLRVKMSPKGISNACNTFSNGEVEDYNLTITNAATDYSITNGEIVLKNARVLQNPFKNQIDIFMDPAKEYQSVITLIDMTGRIIYSRQMNKAETHHQINTTALQNGIYMLMIQNGYQKKTFKMIK